MAAYIIAEVEVTDPATYERYRPIALETVTKYGGKFIVRGGTVEPLEGDPPRPRIVVLEFPSTDQARKWYRSAEYAPGIKLRQSASRSRLFLVEGV
jgi:uncharacterized protein (DUF1330 family)